LAIVGFKSIQHRLHGRGRLTEAFDGGSGEVRGKGRVVDVEADASKGCLQGGAAPTGFDEDTSYLAGRRIEVVGPFQEEGGSTPKGDSIVEAEGDTGTPQRKGFLGPVQETKRQAFTGGA
jgi:hypothetical protein